ncbi:MAG: phosphatase PAP2 family protein [Gammaproteobacteria bacterium]
MAWIDRPLARAIASILPPQAILPNAPDILAPFVAAVTIASLALRIRARRRGRARLSSAALLTAIAGPLALGLKELAKWVFGRTEVRYYLIHPQAADFHWLHGRDVFLGFPSGHMLVATALVAAVTAVYPRLRIWGNLALAALALALLLTSYHFLGDIIAGWLLGRLLVRVILALDARIRSARAS